MTLGPCFTQHFSEKMTVIVTVLSQHLETLVNRTSSLSANRSHSVSPSRKDRNDRFPVSHQQGSHTILSMALILSCVA